MKAGGRPGTSKPVKGAPANATPAKTTKPAKTTPAKTTPAKAGPAKAGPANAAPPQLPDTGAALAAVHDVPTGPTNGGGDHSSDGDGIVGVVVVDGVKVAKVEPVLSPLTEGRGMPVYFSTLRLYTLEDGRQKFACADCADVVGSRGDIRTHRVEVHGAAPSGRRKPSTVDTTGGVDVGRVLRPGALDITVGELLRLAAAVDGFEDLLAAVEQERDVAIAQVAAERQRHAALLAEERQLRLAVEKELNRVKRAIGRLGDLTAGGPN